MSLTTKLSLKDQLPLTCSRSGTCCHGKNVGLNPWELACLAEAKGLKPGPFRDRYTDYGGTRLRFDGATSYKGLRSCSLYRPEFGCSVHAGRPLVCRLYPLGRQRQGEKLHYMHEGSHFPCMDGCPEVVNLPHMSVEYYITGQDIKNGEEAQDEYLKMMQNIADGAFALLLETGLAASGDRLCLRLWREMAREDPEQLAQRLGSLWIDLLMLPDLSPSKNDPVSFCHLHDQLIQRKAQEAFGKLDNESSYGEASGIMMGMALHLGRSLGANPSTLVEHWIATAKEYGALD